MQPRRFPSLFPLCLAALTSAAGVGFPLTPATAQSSPQGNTNVGPRGALFGVVRDASGGVLTNARVTLHWRNASLGIRTGWDGSYRFSDLPADSGYKITAVTTRYRAVTQGPLSVPADRPSRLDFALRRSSRARATGTLTVLARTFTGGALAGARVEVLSGPEDARGVTDRTGRFDFRLSAGTYRFSVTAPGHRAALSESIKLRPSGKERVILRPVAADPTATFASLFGIVWDPIDRFAGGAQVDAIFSGPVLPATTNADERGEYHLETLTPGEWLVGAQGGNRLSSGKVTQVLTPGEEARVDLDLLTDEIAAEGAQLTGTVTDEDGRPIPDATVTATQTGNPTAQTLTANNGRYVLEGLAPGPYSVNVGRTGFTPATRIFLTTARHRTRADFRLAAGTPGPGRIIGVVRTRNGGVPLVGARVRVLAGAAERSVLTDLTGTYVFEQLPPGPYRLRATRRNFRQQDTQGFPLAEGQTVNQDFGLRRK